MPNWTFNKVRFYGDNVKKVKDFLCTEENQFDFNKIIPQPENVDWYEWRISNWDTKWNAHDVCWSGDNFVSFTTAWSVPEKIYYKLAELFPDVPFTVDFADEDLSCNNGTIDYDGEHIVTIYEDSFEFACDVWGYDVEEMKGEYACC